MMAPWLTPVYESVVRRADAGALPHALLFLGPLAAGAELATALARRLLCVGDAPGTAACGQCRSCQLLQAGTHPDSFQLHSESRSGQITVDQVRALIERAGLTASLGRYRVFWIDGADRMNRNAANALLKTLEEPPANTVLLLTAAYRSSLPPTIVSRCQVYPLPGSGKGGLDWLVEQVPALEPEQAQSLLAAVGDPHTAAALVASESAALDGLTEPLEPALAGVLRGEVDIVSLAARWNDALADWRLRRMARLWRDLLARRLSATPDRAAGGGPLSGLTSGMDLASLVRNYEQAVETRRLLATQVRGELQFEAMLVALQQQAATANKG